MVNIRSTTKRFILFMFILSTGVIGYCGNGWIGNNIKEKRDHKESSVRYIENWNFADGIVMSILKRLIGFLIFKYISTY